MSKNRRKKSTSKEPPIPQEIEAIAKEAHVDPLDAAKVIAVSWTGPLPPPNVLNQYPTTIQKAIISQATSQMNHRHSIENQVVASNIGNAGKGMWFAFVLTATMVMAGTYLISIGKSAEGLASIFLPTGFQAGNFLLRRFKGFNRMKNDTEKENDQQVRGNYE